MIPRLFFSLGSCLALTLLGGAALRAQTISTATTTAVSVASGNTLTLTSSGSITLPASSSANAVTLNGGTSSAATTLLNSGSIAQNGTGRGVASAGTGQYISIQNMAGATISAVGNDGLAVGTGNGNTVNSATLTNAGTIQTTTTGTSGNQAVNFNKIVSGTNSITNSGTISAQYADAVRPGVNGTVNNSGTIRSTAINGGSSDGIDAQTNSGAQITNSGLIEGGRHGITGGDTTGKAFALSFTNQAGGTLQGDNGAGVNLDGISAALTATIINNGTITGNGASVASGSTTQDGDGVDVDGVVNLTNTGTIRSVNAIGDTSEGVTVGGGTISNSGIIEGDIAAGNTSGAAGKGITVLGIDTTNPIVAMYANTTITNSGTIKGQTTSGITVGVSNNGVPVAASGFTTTINNLAGGTIEGGGTAAVIQTGADNDTVSNAGTIRADGTGMAVELGAGTNTLNVTGGSAVILGDVSGGVGSTNSAFNVDPGAGNRFTYAGSISNFATVKVSSGTVVFSGASSYAGATTVAGGTLVAANSTGSATGTGAVGVQGGATLAGSGTLTGDVTVAANATLAPGVDASRGTLTLGGNLTISSQSLLVFKLGPNAAGSDVVNVAGTFTLTGGQAVVNLTDNGITAGTRYTLLTYGASSGVTANGFVFGSVPAGFSGTFDVNGNTLGVTVNAVPEPSALAALVLAMALLAWTVRRRAAVRA